MHARTAQSHEKGKRKEKRGFCLLVWNAGSEVLIVSRGRGHGAVAGREELTAGPVGSEPCWGLLVWSFFFFNALIPFAFYSSCWEKELTTVWRPLRRGINNYTQPLFFPIQPNPMPGSHVCSKAWRWESVLCFRLIVIPPAVHKLLPNMTVPPSHSEITNKLSPSLDKICDTLTMITMHSSTHPIS